MLSQQQTINCKGHLISVEKPIVMGILNITPDSFYDGGTNANISTVVKKAEQMLEEGATILDIGGMSSRPGATIISVEEELKRVLPVITAIIKEFPEAIISIDTVQSVVAKQAIEAGAAIVNDISAGKIDKAMYETVAQLGVPYILMHMQGKPKDMQADPIYEAVQLEVLDFFIAELGKLRTLGVKDVIIDPGFGFGKQLNHNYQLLKEMHIFKILEVPILAGLSRKSMIYKVLDCTPKEALNGTSVLNLVALQQGASILRVHDVKEAMETIRLFNYLETVSLSYTL